MSWPQNNNANAVKVRGVERQLKVPQKRQLEVPVLN